MCFSGSAASWVSQGTSLPAQDISNVSPNLPSILRAFKKDVSFYPERACSKVQVHFNELNELINLWAQVCREHGEASDRQPAQVSRQRHLPDPGAAG